MFRQWLFTSVLILIAGSAALAEAPRTIAWDDLVPNTPVLVDPFTHLTPDQRVELRLIAQARIEADRGIAEPESRISDRNLKRKLQDQGLDVEALLAQFDDFRTKVAERDRIVVDSLDAQLIRMPGYVLPLEFSGSEVTEFLLVPYVGACIHVPPPPLNQIVYVHARKAFKSDNLYTPVWVTGRVQVAKMTKTLSLVDGSAAISAGYSMDAIRVDPYEK